MVPKKQVVLFYISTSNSRMESRTSKLERSIELIKRRSRFFLDLSYFDIKEEVNDMEKCKFQCSIRTIEQMKMYSFQGKSREPCGESSNVEQCGVCFVFGNQTKSVTTLEFS